MAEVIILCGKVAAGKTTYAKQLARSLPSVILSIDDLVVSLRDHCEGPRQLRELEGKIRAYDGSLAKQLVPQGITCIIDHGHWTRDSRRQIIDVCRADGLPYRLVWLTCPRGIRLQRLKQRNEQVRSSGEKGYVIDAEQLERFDSWFEELSEEERMHAEILETGNS